MCRLYVTLKPFIRPLGPILNSATYSTLTAIVLYTGVTPRSPWGGKRDGVVVNLVNVQRCARVVSVGVLEATIFTRLRLSMCTIYYQNSTSTKFRNKHTYSVPHQHTLYIG